jgi:hypothetical protein
MLEVRGVLSTLFYDLATVYYGQARDAFHAEDIRGLVPSRKVT